MICEYALDPELVARWHDPKEWAFFREAFGSDSGRFGSVVNSKDKWKQAVMRAFYKAKPSASSSPLLLAAIEGRIGYLAERMIERGSSHPECPTWLGKVVAEHVERPFHGILSMIPDKSVPAVMTPDMLFEEHPPAAWRVPPNPAPPRTAEGLATALSPLLTRCREVVFVDPWFDPIAPRYLDSLRALLAVLWGPRRCFGCPTAELVFAEFEGRGKVPPGRAERSANYLLSQCKESLPDVIPSGHGLSITVIRQRPGAEKLHNRYVLTTLAGVGLGTGLDAANGEAAKFQSDDLCRLSSEQLVKRWGQYKSARDSYFDIAAGPFLVNSAG